MAKDGMGTVIGLAAGAGILWYAYNSGWLSAFGLGPTVAATTAPPATTPPVTGTTPAVNTQAAGSGAGTAPTPTPSGPCGSSGVLAPALAFAQAANTGMKLGPTGTDQFSMDQWNFYLDKVCTGLSAQAGLIADTVFPGDPNRGGPLNWNAYAGYATQHGLSGLRRIAASGMGTRLVRKGVACC